MGLAFGQYLASTLEKGEVFFDVGANIGFYSLFAAQRVGPTGRVFSFEPDPMTFESLERSARRNGFAWQTCVNVALSDREGEMPFFTCSDGSAHSLLPEIESRTLETFEETEFTEDWQPDEARLVRPSATWTYLVNDNPFGSELDRLIASVGRGLKGGGS